MVGTGSFLHMPLVPALPSLVNKSQVSSILQTFEMQEKASQRRKKA